MQTANVPIRVATNVAIIIGMNISEGFAAPICALYTITVMGISVSPDALSTRNIIIGLDASSFRGLIS